MNPSPDRPAPSRRSFLLGAAAGLGTGLASWAALRYGPEMLAWMRSRKPGHLPEPPALGYASRPAAAARGLPPMPGLYPGRVIEVRHRDSVSPTNEINAEVVGQMIDRGMAELTGADVGDVMSAWSTFFGPGDVVGIKVNPVGKGVGNLVGSISSPAVLVKVVESLKEVGIRPRDIIVFERYANEFADAGYDKVLRSRPLEGVRWYGSSSGYSEEQLDVAGFDAGNGTSRDTVSPELARHTAGYDPDVFTTMGYAGSWHSKRDDRRFRTHMSVILTRMINKMITLPVLKDHRSAGVTLALKNMSHGMNNNVARSHLGKVGRGFSDDSVFVSGPNQCNTFIPQAVSQHVLRQRSTLHILDGLIGVYEGGPGCWNRTWATWPHKGLFFATDPVAMDHVGWDIIDGVRLRRGWPPVAQMGLMNQSDALTVRTFLSGLASGSPAESAVLQSIAQNLHGGRASDTFNLRQPEHIILAGELGLGTFERDKIWYRRINLA